MKYYVSFGEYQTIHQSENSHLACIAALKSRLDPINCFTEEVCVSLVFRVSQRGHAAHSDDLYISLQSIVEVLLARRDEDNDQDLIPVES